MSLEARVGYQRFEHHPVVIPIQSKANKLRADYLREHGTYKLPEGARFQVHPDTLSILKRDMIEQRMHVGSLGGNYPKVSEFTEADDILLYQVPVEGDMGVPKGDVRLAVE